MVYFSVPYSLCWYMYSSEVDQSKLPMSQFCTNHNYQPPSLFISCLKLTNQSYSLHLLFEIIKLFLHQRHLIFGQPHILSYFLATMVAFIHETINKLLSSSSYRLEPLQSNYRLERLWFLDRRFQMLFLTIVNCGDEHQIRIACHEISAQKQMNDLPKYEEEEWW